MISKVGILPCVMCLHLRYIQDLSGSNYDATYIATIIQVMNHLVDVHEHGVQTSPVMPIKS